MAARKNPDPDPVPPPAASFEEAMERLDAIVQRMEGENLPLAELLARYEEGVTLAGFCEKQLDEAEEKVRLITQRAGGGAALTPFEEDPDDARPNKPREDLR